MEIRVTHVSVQYRLSIRLSAEEWQLHPISIPIVSATKKTLPWSPSVT